MIKVLSPVLLVLVFAIGSLSQPVSKTATNDKRSAIAVSPTETAQLTFAAHGGEKLKKLQTLLLKGSAELSFQGQMLPAAFSTAVSGDRYYFEIVTAVQQLKQVFDGRQTHSSIPGISLPPVTSLGFPLLPRIGDKGYNVSALPEGGKKRYGFRLTTPEGFYTDFIVDEKTNQVKSYESKWLDGSDRAITTSVAIDEFQLVDGLLIPKKYAQRFDLGPITAYASFKAKDIKVNTPIEDAAFAVPR